MKIPFIDITRYEPNLLEQITLEVSNLLKEGQFVGGKIVTDFEEHLAKYTNARHAIGCANGTDAIQVALRLAGIGPGDKVILPDMTFWATFEAIVNVGAIPCPVDVSYDTLHMTVDMVKAAIEIIKPKAIILVHLYGWACEDTEQIRQYCIDHNIVLIEDCAQAVGVKINDISIISGAEIATTSFYPAKVLGASGDAGAVFVKKESHSVVARQLINHGRISHYEHGFVGWNSRLGAYEATFLVNSLSYLEDRLNSRRNVLKNYYKFIKQTKLSIRKPGENIQETGYLSVAMMDPELRPRFLEYLKKHNIGYGTVYPGAMSRQPGAKNFIGPTLTNGTADLISRSIVNFPCFAYMRQDEIDYVISCVNDFC